MATVVFLPALVPDMTDGTLSRWLVKEAMPVAAGAPLAELTTDGKTVVMPAPVGGVLLRCLRQPGAGILVEGVFAIIGEPGEAIGFDRGAIECYRLELLLDFHPARRKEPWWWLASK